ncbi:MAG TPA: hypothetical protein P5246_01170, partial [Candidatus Omnitrophota bacterium]|nr:hypothetical protein [Candidatus Omnitrophota bacterium]
MKADHGLNPFVAISALGGDGELGAVARIYLDEYITTGQLMGVIDHQALLANFGKEALDDLEDVLMLDIASEVSTNFLRRNRMAAVGLNYTYSEGERKEMVAGWDRFTDILKNSGRHSLLEMLTENLPRPLTGQLIRNKSRTEVLPVAYLFTMFFDPADIHHYISSKIIEDIGSHDSWAGIQRVFSDHGFYTEMTDPNNKDARAKAMAFLNQLAGRMTAVKKISHLQEIAKAAKAFADSIGKQTVFNYLAHFEEQYSNSKERYYIFKYFVAYILPRLAEKSEGDSGVFEVYAETVREFIERINVERLIPEAILVVYALLGEGKVTRLIDASRSAEELETMLASLQRHLMVIARQRQERIYQDEILDLAIQKVLTESSFGDVIGNDGTTNAAVLGWSSSVSGRDGESFDDVLVRAWDHAWDLQAFLVSREDMQRTLVQKRLGPFMVRLTPREVKLRQPDWFGKPVQLDYPFNPDKFHFGKVADKEVLIDGLSFEGRDWRVIVNGSPHSRGHSLLVPAPRFTANQYFDRLDMVAFVSVMGLTKGTVFGNSLWAGASMNSKHFQIYFDDLYGFNYVQMAGLNWQIYHQVNFSDMSGYPGRYFAIRSFDRRKLAQAAWSAVSYLEERNIPFNIAGRARTVIFMPVGNEFPAVFEGQPIAVPEKMGVFNIMSRELFDRIHKGMLIESMEQTDLPIEPYHDFIFGFGDRLASDFSAAGNAAVLASEQETAWLERAVEISRQKRVEGGAMSVGAMIVHKDGGVVATGWRQSFNSMTVIHAEKNAILAAKESGLTQ